MIRCDACTAPAAVIAPGSDEIRAPGGILLHREVPDLQWCLACAELAGWPNWPSERGQTDMLNGDAA